MNSPILWLACGVLRAELDELHASGRIGGTLRYLDSMLHMQPRTLEKALSAKMADAEESGGRTVLIYGDCCAHMLDMVRDHACTRVDAVNCVQMLAGRERYRELMRSESFMLLPEWALRWKEIMHTELGLSPDIARELMGENRRELVYIDTGLKPVPRAELAACGEYTGLPWRIEKTGLDNLLSLLLEAAGDDA